jgi:hypothetical protein
MDTETLPSLPPFHLAIPCTTSLEFKAFADLNQLFAV